LLSPEDLSEVEDDPEVEDDSEVLPDEELVGSGPPDMGNPVELSLDDPVLTDPEVEVDSTLDEVEVEVDSTLDEVEVEVLDEVEVEVELLFSSMLQNTTATIHTKAMST